LVKDWPTGARQAFIDAAIEAGGMKPRVLAHDAARVHPVILGACGSGLSNWEEWRTRRETPHDPKSHSKTNSWMPSTGEMCTTQEDTVQVAASLFCNCALV